MKPGPAPTEVELEVMEAEFKSAERLLADFRAAHADALRALKFRRSDFPRLERDWALGGNRFEDIMAGGAVEVNFKSALTRFAKQHLPGFRSQKAYEGFEFSKVLGEQGQVFVRFEKIHRALGKVYRVFIGFRPPHVPVMATPMIQLIEFYDGRNGGWSYRTADDLDATLEEAGRLVSPVIEPLERAVLDGVKPRSEAVIFGALTFREAVMAAAPIIVRRAPGCTFLSRASLGMTVPEGDVSVIEIGKSQPGRSWVLHFDDLVRHQSLLITLPFAGEATFALSDDVAYLEGDVHTHLLHQPAEGELLMPPDLEGDATSISSQLELTIQGLADTPELASLALRSRKQAWKPESVLAMFSRNASDSIDRFSGWRFDFEMQREHERVECTVNSPARLKGA